MNHVGKIVVEQLFIRGVIYNIQSQSSRKYNAKSIFGGYPVFNNLSNVFRANDVGNSIQIDA